MWLPEWALDKLMYRKYDFFIIIIVLRRTNVFTVINISSYFMSKTIQETILMYIFTKQIVRYSLKKFFGLTVTSIFGIIFAFPTYPSNIFTKGCSCDSGSLTWPNNPLLYHLTIHKVIMFFENTQLGSKIILSAMIFKVNRFSSVSYRHTHFLGYKNMLDAYCRKSIFFAKYIASSCKISVK